MKAECCSKSFQSSLCPKILSMGCLRSVTHPHGLYWLLGRPFPGPVTAQRKLSSNAIFMQIATYILKLKANTWKKHSLLVLRGLVDSIDFLWQIRPECSNKKRTRGFCSGVYSPPHESVHNRKWYEIYNELIHQHICFSSVLAKATLHIHTCAHTHVSRNTWLQLFSCSDWKENNSSKSMLIKQSHNRLHAGLQVKLVTLIALDAFCIRTKCILCFEFTNKFIYTRHLN